MLQVEPVGCAPTLTHPRTPSPHQHGLCLVAILPSTLGKWRKGISEHPGSGKDEKEAEVTPQAVVTHRALVLVVADVLDGSDVDDVDALLLSRETGVLLVHPHSCLLWSLTEIFWQKIHPMKLAVSV